MTKPWGVLAFLALASGCRCGPGPISTVEAGFRVENARLDFGRVLEGTTATKSVTLVAETRSSVHVTLATDLPFSSPADIEVSGGSAIEVPLSFLAGNGPVSGELVLSAGGAELRVALSGLGVRPLVCGPSLACHRSDYSFDEDRCVEMVEADDTACEPGTPCLVKGRCRAGSCLGVARDCDDTNVCTVDACAPDAGCVHAPKACPTPTNPCMVPVCDPVTGCGEVAAQDFTPCGSVDCVNVHLCVSGACVVLPTPDGVECAPQVVCVPRSECHHQVCVPSDAGAWNVAWRTPLDYRVDTSAPALLRSQSNLFFTACGLPAAPDASVPDGGDCGLVSYTANGYERFSVRAEDGAARGLLSVSARGVALRSDGGVELRSRMTGGWLERLEGARSLALRSDGAFVGPRSLADGGVELVTWASDGGVSAVPSLLSAEAVVAEDERDRLWTWEADAGVLSWPAVDADGGDFVNSMALPSTGDTLAVSSGSAVLGGRLLVTLDADGGLALLRDLLEPDAGPLTALAAPQLLGLGTAVVFHRRCPTPLTSCALEEQATFVRAWDLQHGTMASEAQVLPGGVGEALLGVALVDAVPGAVATLVRGDVDAGLRPSLQIFARGSRVLTCPLPDEARDVRGRSSHPAS